MPALASDGLVKISFLASCANPAAPTVAEANAGVDITPFVTPSGLKIETSTDAVATSVISSTSNTSVPGRRKDEISIEFVLANQFAGAPFTTFNARQSGYLLIRRSIAYGTAYAAAQKVSVYPVQAADIQVAPPAENELEKMTVPFMTTGAPSVAVSLV